MPNRSPQLPTRRVPAPRPARLTGRRRRAVRRARRLASGVACVALFLPGCGGMQTGGESSILADLVEPFTPPTPGQTARDAFNVYDPDKRRESIALLAAAPFGGEAPYVRTYRLLLDDPDPTVRAASIKALGTHGTVADATRLTPFLEDDIAYVRWEAAEALRKIHNAAAVEPLIRALQNDPDADVRQAAAEALGQYAQPMVFDTLVGALTDVNYGVVRAASQSLSILTGRDFGADPAAWIEWSNSRRARLFADQLPYSYQPYPKPPGWLDQVQFWRDPEPTPRRLPAGLQGPTGSDET